MQEVKNIILGNGISAKIFAFYNREYKIIGTEATATTDSIAGKFITLQNNKYNFELIEDLEFETGQKIEYSLKNFDVLNYQNGKYVQGISDDKREIMDKKLTDYLSGEKLQYINPIFQDDIAFATTHMEVSRIIDVDFNPIIKSLKSATDKQIIDRSKITHINIVDKIIYTENGAYKYENCVSTIPMNIFLKLSGVDDVRYKALGTYIIEADENALSIPKIPSNNAIVYFPQKEIMFSRIDKINGVCYAEITGSTLKSKYEKFSYMPNSKMIRVNQKEVFDGVMFLGRQAEWNPNIRIQDVVRKSKAKIKMQTIWNNQKAFSGRFFDFSEDIEKVQKNVKECSMLMINETFDLLDNINWKDHSSEKKKLNQEKIEEEWIDIYKYWLSIGIALGFSYEDFLDAYDEKSKKLIKKYGV